MAVKDHVETLKNGLDAVKSVFVIGVIIVFAFYTDFVLTVFDKYGVTEIDAAGVKIDRSQTIKIWKDNSDRLPQLQAQLEAAQRDLVNLQAQYLEATSALEKVKSELDQTVSQPPNGSNDGAATLSDIDSLTGSVLGQKDATLASVSEAVQSLEAASADAASVVAGFPTADVQSGFAIIFGGDKTQAAAEDELAKAENNGFSPTLYYRDGMFRSAVPYASKAEADQEIQRARDVLRRDAYIVNLASWCPQPVHNPNGFEDCGT